jgi:hypothetical protein
VKKLRQMNRVLSCHLTSSEKWWECNKDKSNVACEGKFCTAGVLLTSSLLIFFSVFPLAIFVLSTEEGKWTHKQIGVNNLARILFKTSLKSGLRYRMLIFDRESEGPGTAEKKLLTFFVWSLKGMGDFCNF